MTRVPRHARRVAALCLGVLAVLPAPAPHAEERVVGRETRTTQVVTFRGTTLWSSYRNGAYRLVLHRDGLTRALPAQPRPVPFDVDLGPDAQGRIDVVYSRCAEEATSSRVARGCDLFRYDLGSGRETRLRDTARRGHSETSPSIWRTRIAFARHRDPRDRRVPVLDRLRARDRAGREWRIAGGTPAGASIADADGQAHRLDLEGTRLAFDWTYTADRCQTSSLDDEQEGFPSGSEVWFSRIGGRSRRVASGCSDDGTYAYTPSLTDGLLVYTDASSERAQRVAVSPADGVRRGSAPLPRATVSASTHGDTTAIVTSVGERFEVVLRES